MLHLAARAPRLRAPVTSTLDRRNPRPGRPEAMSRLLLQLKSKAYRPVVRGAILVVRSLWLHRLLRCLQNYQCQSVWLSPRRPCRTAVTLASSRPAPRRGLRWSCQWSRPGQPTAPLSSASGASLHQTGPAAPIELPARRLRRDRLSNPTFNRSSNGRSPGPGWRYAVHCRQPGPGALPSSPG